MAGEPRRPEPPQEVSAGSTDFRALFEGVMRFIPEGVTIAEAPDARILAVSRFGLRLLGREREDLIGTAAEAHPEQWQVYHPDGVTLADPEELPLTRATRHGEVVIDEPWILRRLDGSELHLLCNAGPVRDAEGRIRWGVITWREVTESRRAEAALRAGEARLRRAQDIGGIGDWEWDLLTDEASWSPSLHRLLRTDPGSFVLRGRSFFDFIHPEDRPSAEQAVRDLLERDRPIDIELRVVLADGEERWLASRGLAERDASGRALRIVGVNFDVTDRKQVELAFEEERARLMAYKDSLLQEANHRIKNSLTMAASMLRMQARQPHNAPAGGQLEQSADRLIALGRLYDLLARSGDGDDVEVSTYLHDLAASLESSLRQPGQPVAVRVEAESCSLPAPTATDLGLIFNELVTNACKHGRATDGSCEVRARFRVTGRQASLSIEDGGRGLPEGFSLERDGGLGMRLARRLSRNLGGSLGAGRGAAGARFEVRFPLAGGRTGCGASAHPAKSAEGRG